MQTARTLRLLEDDVVAGLRERHKRLPTRLLYDDAGAELFARITTLDAYYPTRTEHELLDRHLPVVAQHAGPNVRVIEPGCGEPRKAHKLLAALDRPSSYVGIDIAQQQLLATAQVLRTAFPRIDVQTLVADYTHPFVLPPPQHTWSRSLVFFPGSTIGNFEPSEARRFLSMLARIAGEPRMLLLGADATREPDVLLRAYDDEHGVTAAFDKNVLAHLNRVRNATFDLDAFDHRAVWNAEASRVEMQLVSKRRQLVRVDGELVTLAEGEPIVTEHCYKHTPAAMQAILAGAGWRTRQVFTSARRAYRLWLCEPLTWGVR